MARLNVKDFGFGRDGRLVADRAVRWPSVVDLYHPGFEVALRFVDRPAGLGVAGEVGGPARSLRSGSPPPLSCVCRYRRVGDSEIKFGQFAGSRKEISDRATSPELT
ncbi:MAG: hypothetical protein ABSE69_12310 [Roseiarcus sp.]